MKIEESKTRLGLDIGAVIFMIGISFNAGIQYSKIAINAESIKTTNEKMSVISDNRLQLSERMTHVETLLSDIKEELHRGNNKK